MPAPVKPTVPFAALEALDVRVGTIKKVEDVPSSSKLDGTRAGGPSGASAR